MRNLFPTLIAFSILLLSSCGQKVQMNTNTTSQPLTSSQLDPHIPPPNPDRYKFNQSGKDWPNPFLMIRRDGIELTVKAASIEHKIVSPDELKSVLIALPLSAWPYGKVVAVAEPSLRSPDDRLIEENKAKTVMILQSLGVTLDWRPMA